MLSFHSVEQLTLQIFFAHIPLRTAFGTKNGINNMKSTWRMQKFCVGAPTQPIFHWLVLGFCFRGNTNFMFFIGGNANLGVFRYQHVCIPKAKLWCWGSKPTPGPNAKVLPSLWNIGFRDIKTYLSLNCVRINRHNKKINYELIIRNFFITNSVTRTVLPLAFL